MIHNDERIDNYYWLNDHENPKIIEYLKDENEYTLHALGGQKNCRRTCRTKSKFKKTTPVYHMSGMDIPNGENLKKEKNIPNIGEKD